MRAFATELAVNLRKESLEQMATAALQAKLAEMTVRRTATRPQPPHSPGTFWAVVFSFGSDSTTQRPSLFQPFWPLRFHSSSLSCLRLCVVCRQARLKRAEARETGAFKKHTKLQADITAVEVRTATRHPDPNTA